MVELSRLSCQSEHGDLTLVLTAQHLLVEPSPEFAAYLTQTFKSAREGVTEAPRLVGWLVEKVTNLAANQVEKVFQPHDLHGVELKLEGDQLGIKLGPKVLQMATLKVDPTDGFIFESKLRQALPQR